MEGGQHSASSAEQIKKKPICANTCVLQNGEINDKGNLSEVRKRMKRKKEKGNLSFTKENKTKPTNI